MFVSKNIFTVAREMERNANSVSKYVQMKDVSKNIRIAVENFSQQTK